MCQSSQPAPTSSNVTQTSIPEYARPYVERMLGKAEALSNTPYQAYQGDRLAGFTPMQQKAFEQVQNLGPSKQLGAGTQLAGMAGLGALQAGQNYQNMATDPGAMQAYMSPYVQGALNPMMDEARRQSNITGLQNKVQAMKSGAFGGSGRYIQEAERQGALGRNLASIYGTGMQNAFDRAQQAQQFGSTLGLQGYGQANQAANTLGQLGQAQFGQQKDIINATQNAGTMQQGLEQQRLSQKYQDFLNQRDYQKQQQAYMSDMLRGLPLSQSSSQTQQSAPSWMSQAAGLGFLGKGMGLFAEGGEVSDRPVGLAELAIMQMGKD
jgi:hypothetical protein